MKSFIRQTVKRGLSAVLPRDRFLVRGPRSSVASGNQGPIDIALTFDDGPHPEWTPAILDALSQQDWTGTFFIIGDRAARYPALLRRIVEEGHVLGNHTWSHAAPKETPTSTFLDEVRRTSDLIEELTGHSTALMRPPLGQLTAGKFFGLWSRQQSIVLWNIDPKDFAMHDETEASAWAQGYEPRRGDVVLLHDRLPFAATIVNALAARLQGEVRSVGLSDGMTVSANCSTKREVSLA